MASPTLVKVELTDNYEYWRLLTNNLVSLANMGVYTNGTSTSDNANVVISGEITSNTFNIKNVNPTLSFKNSSAVSRGYIRYDETANAMIMFSNAANASVAYHSNGALTVNNTVVVTVTGTQTLTNKTLTNPILGGSVSVGGSSGTGALEVGRTDGVAEATAVDFHTGATAVDYDTRIYASGGTGVSGGGTINIVAGTFTLGGVPLVTTTGTQTLTNKTLTAPVLSGSITGTYTLAGTPTFPATVMLTTGAQTLAGLKTVSMGTATTFQAYVNLQPTDWGAGKPRLAIDKSATAGTWDIGLWDGVNNNGIINVRVSSFTWNDVPLVGTTSTQTLTNKTLTSPAINTPTIVGGSFTGGTDIAVADGGTGASNDTQARQNLYAERTKNYVSQATDITYTNLNINTNGHTQFTGAVAAITLDSTLLYGGWHHVFSTDSSAVVFTAAATINGAGTFTLPAYSTVQIFVNAGLTAFVTDNDYDIVRWGINGNGRWVRFRDGTQICSWEDTGLGTNVLSGSIYESATTPTWTFPVVFSTATNITVYGSSVVSRWVSFGTPTSNNVTYGQKNSVSSGASQVTRMTAIGKWR